MDTCGSCGKASPDVHEVELARDGLIIATFKSCDACMGTAHKELAELRHEFNALLDKGVSREEANRILIARIDGRRAG